jgi:hypothetical protein
VDHTRVQSKIVKLMAMAYTSQLKVKINVRECGKMDNLRKDISNTIEINRLFVIEDASLTQNQKAKDNCK